MADKTDLTALSLWPDGGDPTRYDGIGTLVQDHKSDRVIVTDAEFFGAELPQPIEGHHVVASTADQHVHGTVANHQRGMGHHTLWLDTALLPLI